MLMTALYKKSSLLQCLAEVVPEAWIVHALYVLSQACGICSSWILFIDLDFALCELLPLATRHARQDFGTWPGIWHDRRVHATCTRCDIVCAMCLIAVFTAIFRTSHKQCHNNLPNYAYMIYAYMIRRTLCAATIRRERLKHPPCPTARHDPCECRYTFK